ncbi:ABC transporter substrate-binding protein [Allosediminivita pacifica]|uniref:Peptide/nickel transport system substrate-binding protein n=1 Tax=Allosediminivita pacifica TaxID=1267769 RepID=A0A2T6AD58_9RHOB|nr:ABC transporter substrate-binding protein [Allosediminivita pacifica]PTX41754.1 peptide/nickel transport system substrate-binding protein [Allosediminivita pacifica]GGB22786.1 peptide ABC transporter substrate-binding protein [Allosediminivita pacifica]
MKSLPALALGLALAVPATVTFAQDDTLVIGRSASTNALDPGFLREAATVVDNIFDTMVMRDEDMNLVPGLATEWTSINDTTWEFTLREGVTFHNGEPFNADAVKFSLDRVLDPENNAPTISYIRTISSVEVVDPMTVRITTSAPDPLLPTRMSRYPAYIVPPQYIGENGREHFANNPVGTGAYRFVDFVPDERVTLEANPDYWRGAPDIGTVIWRPIPDATARITSLVTGEVQLIENVPVDLVPLLQQTPDADLVQVENGGLTIYLGLRMDKEPLDNVLVRRALNHAIDRESITQNLLGGLATPKGSQVGAADFGYLDVPVAEYDPELSRELLAEAGFPDGFEITMQSSFRYMKNAEVAQTIAQEFEDIGLTVNQETMEWSVYTQTVPFEGPIYMLGWGSTQTLDADAAVYAILKSGEPYSGASIPELDALLDESRSTVDPEARAEILEEIQELAADQVPLITLYQEDQLMGKSPNIEFEGRADARIPVFEITMD